MNQDASFFNMGTISGFAILTATACAAYWKIQDYKLGLLSPTYGFLTRTLADNDTIVNITPPDPLEYLEPSEITTNLTPHIPYGTTTTIDTFQLLPYGVYIAIFVAIVLILIGAISTLTNLPSIYSSVKYSQRPSDYHHNDPSFKPFKHRGEALSNIYGDE